MEYPEITVEYLKNEFQKEIVHDDVSDEQLKELVRLIRIGEREGRDKVDEALDYFNDIFHMHGVEAVSGYPRHAQDSGYYRDINLLYVNTGDSYAATLAYDTGASEFLVTSWGDWVESIEQEEGGDWEEEAWNDWIRMDLNSYLPKEVRDYFDYDADDELADKVLWNAYQKAKEESGEYPVYESGGAYVNTERMGSIYAQIVMQLIKEEGIVISMDGDTEDDDDLQKEEFNRQFSKSYNEYLNEQDQVNRDLINEEAFKDSEEEFSGEIGDEAWEKLFEQNRTEIRSWDWDQIKSECMDNVQENEDGDGYVGACNLGSVLSLAPSGKYYTSWTTNQTSKDEYDDSAFYDALDEVAEEQGGWTGGGEADPTDIFFFMMVDIENEYDEDDGAGIEEPYHSTDPAQTEIEFENKRVLGMSLREEKEKKEKDGEKRYYTMDDVGKSKYTVNFYDGKKTHSDGSEFYDIEIFKNKKKRDDFIKDLMSKGYKEGKRPIYKNKNISEGIDYAAIERGIKLRARYDVDFWEERGFATIHVTDKFEDDKTVWSVNNDHNPIDGELDDDGEQQYYGSGDIDNLIEDGFIKWDDAQSVLDYLDEQGIIEDYDTFAILKGDDVLNDIDGSPLSSDDENDALQMYAFYRLEHPEEEIRVVELDKDVTPRFEEIFEEDKEYWQNHLKSHK